MGMPARADVSRSRPDMPKGAISHHVETEFIGMGEFGADHQWDAKTQVVVLPQPI